MNHPLSRRGIAAGITAVAIAAAYALSAATPAHATGSDVVDFTGTGGLKTCVATAIGANPVNPITQTQLASPSFTTLICSASVASIGPLIDAVNLTTLNLHDNFIADLTPLQGLSKLTSLYLKNNLIEDVTPLGSLTGLTSLTLTSNQVIDVSPLETLTNLSNLQLELNPVFDFTPLGSLTKVTNLNVASTGLTDADLHVFDSMAGLSGFTADHNDLTDASALAVHPTLTSVNLASNHLTDLDGIAGLTKLETLVVKDNALTDLDELATTKALITLDARSNSISSIAGITALSKLETATIASNQLSSVPSLAALSSLGDLNLDANQLTNLDGLAGSVALGKLSAANNRLTSVTGLTGLSLFSLNLAGNRLTNLTALASLPNLFELFLSGQYLAGAEATVAVPVALPSVVSTNGNAIAVSVHPGGIAGTVASSLVTWPTVGTGYLGWAASVPFGSSTATTYYAGTIVVPVVAAVNIPADPGSNDPVDTSSGFDPSGAANDGSQVTGSTSGGVSVAGTLTKMPKARITGVAKVGKKLTVSKSGWDAGVRLSFRWYANGKSIKGATKQAYLVKKSMRGKRLTVKVTARKTGFLSTTITSARTTRVRAL